MDHDVLIFERLLTLASLTGSEPGALEVYNSFIVAYFEGELRLCSDYLIR